MGSAIRQFLVNIASNKACYAQYLPADKSCKTPGKISPVPPFSPGPSLTSPLQHREDLRKGLWLKESRRFLGCPSFLATFCKGVRVATFVPKKAAGFAVWFLALQVWPGGKSIYLG